VLPVTWSSRHECDSAFPQPKPDGKPVFNYRSEGRRFDKGDRCVIPASAFFEYQGPSVSHWQGENPVTNPS